LASSLPARSAAGDGLHEHRVENLAADVVQEHVDAVWRVLAQRATDIPAGDGFQLKRVPVTHRERKLDDNRCPLTRRTSQHHGPPEGLDPVSQSYDP
jgi:hypothetical protein